MHSLEDITIRTATTQANDKTISDTAGGELQSTPETTQVEIVEFTHDQPVQLEQDAVLAEPFEPFKDTHEHDLVSILERPYLVDQSEWSSPQNQGTNVTFIRVRDKLMEQSNFADKISRFAYNRFNVRGRILVNCQRFQVGKLIACAYPTVHNGFDDVSFPAAGTDFISTVSASTMRHIEIDAGTTEEVLIDMPFFNDRECWSSYDSTIDWFLVIKVLNPLGGSTTGEVVTVTTFLEPYDVQLAMPSGQSVEGQKKSEQGIISSTLSTVARVGGSVLSTLAGPVTWAADLASLASSFGFSKPVSVTAVERRTIVPGAGFTNTQGLDSSIVLGFKPDNEVEQQEIEDDMSITSVTRRQGLVATRDWEFGDPIGSVLYSSLVYPSIYTITSHPGADVHTTTPLYYASTFFKYWRGSITYRISFAKNCFYSGKFVASFSPNSTSTPTLDETNNLYRQVVAVKDSGDFLFTIPYVYPKEWARMDEPIGTFSLHVLNRLQASETVPDKIQFNVWHYSTDMEFAIPEANLPAYGRAVRTATPKRHGQAILQSTHNTSTGDSNHLFEVKPFGKTSVYTMGERILNLRELTRRATFAGTYDSSIVMTSWPYILKNHEDVGVSTPSRLNVMQALALAYRFSSGGFIIKLWLEGGDLGYVSQMPEGSAKPFDGTAVLPDHYQNALSHYVPREVSPVLEAKLPFYSSTTRRYNDSLSMYNGRYTDMVPYSFGALEGGATSTAKRHLYLAGADDFTFNMWIVAPIVMYPKDIP